MLRQVFLIGEPVAKGDVMLLHIHTYPGSLSPEVCQLGLFGFSQEFFTFPGKTYWPHNELSIVVLGNFRT